MNQEENRVALIGIIISDISSSKGVNELLHEYNQYIIGRMGIPYRNRNLNIISIAIDAPGNIINELTGKLGQLSGVSSQATFARVS